MAEPLQLIIKSAFDATGVTAATNSINRIDAQINRVSRGVSKFMGLLAGGSALGGVIAFGNSAVKAYAESEAGVARLAKAMQNLGSYSADALRDQLNYAQALQKTTKYSDEQIMAIQATLTTYGLYGEKLKAATLATLNLATQTGDSAAAAKIVGKAYQGQTDTLAKMGIKISDTAVGTQKFDAVMEQLQKRFGGFAENEGKTFSGQLQVMANRMDELKEKMGRELMPVADSWLKWADKAVGYLEKLGSNGTLNLSGRELTIKGLKDRISELNVAIAIQTQNNETNTDAYKRNYAEREKLIGLVKRQRDLMAGDNKPGGGAPGPRGSAPEAELDNATASWTLNERNQLMLAYYRRHALNQRKFNRDSALTEQERARENKKIIRDIEQEWQRGAKSMSGGFEQALMEMNQSADNWRQRWASVISGSFGPAQQAVKDFFNMSSDEFGNLGTLAEKTFKGILNAFYDMITQMIAQYMVFKMVTGMGLGGTAFGNFIGLSRASGGPIPGSKGQAVPIMAHGGEFVLSANVVDAIKRGGSTSGLSGPLAGGGSVSSVNYSPTININGGVSGGNVREICRQIADAGRKGMTEALDAAKVLYKQGAKRSGEAAL